MILKIFIDRNLGCFQEILIDELGVLIVNTSLPAEVTLLVRILSWWCNSVFVGLPLASTLGLVDDLGLVTRRFFYYLFFADLTYDFKGMMFDLSGLILLVVVAVHPSWLLVQKYFRFTTLRLYDLIGGPLV